MKWVAIAKKDFREARRSKLLWAVTGVFTLFIVGVIATSSEGTSAVDSSMGTMTGIGTFLLPLPVLVASYLAITGERESGRIKYLLGLPATRFEVVAGKFVGRAFVAMLAIFVAYLLGAIMLWLRFGELPIAEYVQFITLTLYFTTVWVGIAVGISALSDTRGKALTGVLGIYFVFILSYTLPGMNPVSGTQYVVEEVFGLSPIPGLYDILVIISPAYAYSNATNVLVRGVEFDGSSYAGEYGSEFPFYLQSRFMLMVLFLWLVVPLVVGYLRFRNTELN